MYHYYLSYFKAPITNKVPWGEVTLQDLHKFISTDEKLREATSRVRALLEAGDGVAYRKAKLASLPMVTPAGVFRYARAADLVFPNGLLVVDIDHLQSVAEAEELRDRLFEDAWLQVQLAFVSPSGRGVKLFVPYRVMDKRGTVENFEEQLERAWHYIEAMYGVTPDRACSDICRVCIVCADANAKLRV